MKKGYLRHKLFQIGIIFKGIDGVFETIGAFLLLFINPLTLNKLAYFLTQHELIEDPRDAIANFLIHSAQNLSGGVKIFGFVYLLSHGIIKIFLVETLWKRWLWSYPTAIAFFSLFGAYQMYKYYLTGSFGWLLLTILDILVIALTWLEYKSLESGMRIK